MWGDIQDTNAKNNRECLRKSSLENGRGRSDPIPHSEAVGASPASKPAKGARTIKDMCASRTFEIHRFLNSCRSHKKAPRMISSFSDEPNCPGEQPCNKDVELEHQSEAP